MKKAEKTDVAQNQVSSKLQQLSYIPSRILATPSQE
jgi:hypothetical protein